MKTQIFNSCHVTDLRPYKVKFTLLHVMKVQSEG
jgi:hypothetical protein